MHKSKLILASKQRIRKLILVLDPSSPFQNGFEVVRNAFLGYLAIVNPIRIETIPNTNQLRTLPIVNHQITLKLV